MLKEKLRSFRVLPVVTPREVELTLAVCEALQLGGMQAVEITLRHESALQCIRAARERFPSLTIAAGTVTRPGELELAAAAGADFCVSPGSTTALLQASVQSGVALVPGVGGASEVMLAADHGFDCCKLFPAVAGGGVAMLRALAGPFPDMAFCPTGGLDADNFREFLALDNVVCCGGSWMVDAGLVDSGQWEQVTALAAAALAD